MLSKSKNACKAWVSFNGTGTLVVHDSFNVSSVTDNSAGNYDVNFINSMPNSNYSAVQTVSDLSGTANDYIAVVPASIVTAGSYRIYTLRSSSGAQVDITRVSSVVFAS